MNKTPASSTGMNQTYQDLEHQAAARKQVAVCPVCSNVVSLKVYERHLRQRHGVKG